MSSITTKKGQKNDPAKNDKKNEQNDKKNEQENNKKNEQENSPAKKSQIYFSEGSLVYPGDKLGDYDELTTILSTGVYRIDNSIFSSVLGAFSITSTPIPSSDPEDTTLPPSPDTQQSIPITTFRVIAIKDKLNVPKVNTVVICRVVEIQPRQVLVSIDFAEGSTKPFSSCRGVIRAKDIRALDVDGVVVYESYRPNDIIKALIISLGDTRSYYLSTAKPHLGVIYAENVKGIGMVLIPPKEEFASTALVQYLKCPITGSVQARKAALPM
jgi:exosome complex component CSL4